MISHRFPKPQLEALEARRLFASWSLAPAVPEGSPGSADFQYVVDDTGYHWRATFGDVGEPKTFAEGNRFRAVYDETLPSHADDPGPDRQDYYESLASNLAAEHERRQGSTITFSVVEHADGTFSVVPAPAAAPTEPPAGDAPTALPIDPVAPPVEEPQERVVAVRPDPSLKPEPREVDLEHELVPGGTIIHQRNWIGSIEEPDQSPAARPSLADDLFEAGGDDLEDLLKS